MSELSKDEVAALIEDVGLDGIVEPEELLPLEALSTIRARVEEPNEEVRFLAEDLAQERHAVKVLREERDKQQLLVRRSVSIQPPTETVEGS